MSEEKRRFPRKDINLTIMVDELYRQNNEVIDDIHEEIEVTNISKTGLGFMCKSELPIGFYFNARITIDDENKFYGVLRIIRKRELGDSNEYGCVFVGLADILSKCIDEM
ncbi:MAG: PilZ domain-containing protein [Firmicutes bacterium]|jgi:hypothetical protein|nr:PilZ domain-containing protein [Bacillota bacterium]